MLVAAGDVMDDYADVRLVRDRRAEGLDIGHRSGFERRLFHIACGMTIGMPGVNSKTSGGDRVGLGHEFIS
ncbi:hypothetical protein D3C80_2161360 [compost metagenome]